MQLNGDSRVEVWTRGSAHLVVNQNQEVVQTRWADKTRLIQNLGRSLEVLLHSSAMNTSRGSVTL